MYVLTSIACCSSEINKVRENKKKLKKSPQKSHLSGSINVDLNLPVIFSRSWVQLLSKVGEPCWGGDTMGKISLGASAASLCAVVDAAHVGRTAHGWSPSQCHTYHEEVVWKRQLA